MSLFSVTSGQSVYRGYEYFQEKLVKQMEQGESMFKAIVAGNGGNN